MYGGCCLSEYRVGVCIELHLESLLLELGVLPPVGDGGEDFPEENCEETNTDDTAGDTWHSVCLYFKLTECPWGSQAL